METIYCSPDTLNELILALDPFQQDHGQDYEDAGFEPDIERARR